MDSEIELFQNKKFVVILSNQIGSRDLAYTGALIGCQFGRKVPAMVGRDQMIPVKRAEGNEAAVTRRHPGITTQNLPVLNGLDYANMRNLRASLKKHESLIVTDVTDAAGVSESYAAYAEAIKKTPLAEVNYWGIGIFGDVEVINECTKGLKLYGKQPSLENPVLLERPKRLIVDKSGLPMISLILANNLDGGKLANTAVIIGVTYGKLHGDKLFGPDMVDADGWPSFGLPLVDVAVLNGHSDKKPMMRELREKLHEEPGLLVVDVTDATGKTRAYPDYLSLAEKTPVLETVYWGLGISGSSDLVNKYTEGLDLYITSGEESEQLKKQEAARKLEARKAAAKKEGASAKKELPIAEGSAAAIAVLGLHPAPVAEKSTSNSIEEHNSFST